VVRLLGGGLAGWVPGDADEPRSSSGDVGAGGVAADAEADGAGCLLGGEAERGEYR